MILWVHFSRHFHLHFLQVGNLLALPVTPMDCCPFSVLAFFTQLGTSNWSFRCCTRCTRDDDLTTGFMSQAGVWSELHRDRCRDVTMPQHTLTGGHCPVLLDLATAVEALFTGVELHISTFSLVGFKFPRFGRDVQLYPSKQSFNCCLSPARCLALSRCSHHWMLHIGLSCLSLAVL